MILNNLLSVLDEVRTGLRTLLVLHLLRQLFLLLTLLQKLLLLHGQLLTRLLRQLVTVLLQLLHTQLLLVCRLGMNYLVLTGLLSLTNSGGLGRVRLLVSRRQASALMRKGSGVLDGAGRLVRDGSVLVLGAGGGRMLLLEAVAAGDDGLWNGTGLLWRNISGWVNRHRAGGVSAGTGFSRRRLLRRQGAGWICNGGGRVGRN